MSLFVFSSCAGPVSHLYPDDEAKRPIPVYIISHGWHVGIAIEAGYIKPYLPNHTEIPVAKYLMFGWGDRSYYTNRNAGFGLLLKAALLPTKSVIHVVGIDRPLEDYFRSSTIVRVMVSKQGADQLGKYISSQFSRRDGKMVVAADGLYPNSTFFEANGRYYFPNTSNKWTARALRETGYPISTFYTVTSGNVVKQASEHGVVIQKR